MSYTDQNTQTSGQPGGNGISWNLYRDLPEKMFLGVASALARYLRVPVLWVRVGFVLLTFVHFLGPVIYGLAWAFIPYRPKDAPAADRVVAGSRQLADESRGLGQRLANAARAFLKTFRDSGPEPPASDGDSSNQ